MQCYSLSGADIGTGATGDAGVGIIVEGESHLSGSTTVSQADGADANNLLARPDTQGTENTQVVLILIPDLKSRLLDTQFFGQRHYLFGAGAPCQKQLHYHAAVVANTLRIGLDHQPIFCLIQARGHQLFPSLAGGYFNQAEAAGAIGGNGVINT